MKIPAGRGWCFSVLSPFASVLIALMPLTLPPVYPITPDALRGAALLTWAEALLGEGCRFLQYRRKTGDDSERLRDLRALLALARVHIQLRRRARPVTQLQVVRPQFLADAQRPTL